jgi:hypothetical protein
VSCNPENALLAISAPCSTYAPTLDVFILAPCFAIPQRSLEAPNNAGHPIRPARPHNATLQGVVSPFVIVS